MREANFRSVPTNRASVWLTTTLYDRRALDCTSDRPLIYSLNHLTFLASSSARVRETLCADGGVERLIAIIKECVGGSNNTPMQNTLTAWKWTLALQSLVYLGTRGTEQVRKRVVEAGIVPVLTTILDNYLRSREAERERFKKKCDLASYEISNGRTLTVDNMSTSLTSGATATATNTSLAALNRGDRNLVEAGTTENGTVYLSVNAMDSHVTTLRHLRDDNESQTESQTTQSQPRALRSQQTETMTQTQPLELSDVAYTLPGPFPRLNNQEVQMQDSLDNEETLPGDGDDEFMLSRRQMGVEQEPQPVQVPLSAAALVAAAASAAAAGRVTPNPIQPAALQQGEGQMQLDQQTGQGLQDQGQATEALDPRRLFNRSSHAVHSIPSLFKDNRIVPREDEAMWALEILAFVSKYSYIKQELQNTHLVPSLSLRDPALPPLRKAQCDVRIPSASCDVDDTEMTDIAPALSYGASENDSPEASQELIHPDSHYHFDYDEYDFEADQDIDAEYLGEVINIFPLVERFTVRSFSGDVQYWAGVVMRNSCRKDEAKGGLRQCACFDCGKWEEFPRQFAKCRRCKRTKYCSKKCQLKAWGMHRHWCLPSNGTGSSSASRASTTTSSSQHQHLQAPTPTPPPPVVLPQHMVPTPLPAATGARPESPTIREATNSPVHEPESRAMELN